MNRRAFLLTAAVTAPALLSASPQAYALKEMIMKETEGVFPKGELYESPHFSGKVWLKMLVDNDAVFNCPVAHVTFEPGCRNSWHTHPGGQLLLVTGGEGRYQEKDGPMRQLKPGDVVKIAPDVEHWHGAAPHSWFSHLAVSTNPQSGIVTWLDPVTDEQYRRQPGA